MYNKVICWIKAIPLFVKSGQWVPHVYTCDYQKAIIIANDNGFRVSNNFQHKQGEEVYTDACLITCTCKHCGHKTYSWYKYWNDVWKLKR